MSTRAIEQPDIAKICHQEIAGVDVCVCMLSSC